MTRPRESGSGRARRGRRARRAAGFTLLELLVASALIAVLAVLAWRGLDTILSSRERISTRSDELRALTVGFAQIDDDLRRAWPVRLLELPRPWLGFSQTESGGPLTMELIREGGGALDTSRIERVAYRLRNGVLERGFGPLLNAAAGDANSLPLSNVPLVWQPLVGDVVAIQFRGWRLPGGWIDGEALALSTAQVAQMLNDAQRAWLAASAAGAAPGSAATGTSATAAATTAAGTQAKPPAQPAAADAGAAGLSPADQAYAQSRDVANSLQVRGVELTLMRANGERYVRIFPVED